MTSASFDLTARIEQLFIYPVKSCAGIELKQATLTETGLDLDRAWMVVDESGEFVTQRDFPRMALIRPQMRLSDMVLKAPGMLGLHLALDAVEGPARVRVWDDELDAWDMGPLAAQWFSDFLGAKLRLVRFDPECRRLSSKRWTGEHDGLNQFSDGFAMLVTSTASLAQLNDRLVAAGHQPVTMERFRPNLVLSGVEAHDEDRVGMLQVLDAAQPVQLKAVKPCPRCPIPNIDPLTALSSPEVSDMLQTYRQNEMVGGAVTFGMNCIVLQGDGAQLAVGQTVGADWRFD